jgi:beta-glucosidase
MPSTSTAADLSVADRIAAPFRWGVATSAYQIEGAVAEDGRTPSIWDTFCRVPGAVANGDTGDVACDHYHRMPDDVTMIADLGVDSYRFSVSWPRVQPGGRGPANAAGVAFYSRLVDELLGRGIEPWLTLYHWDLPQELEDAGGWPARDTALRFADYASLVHDALGDRVQVWTTLNEPWCSAFLGYGSGGHAPGRTDPADALAAAHHLMVGHGLAVEAMRAARSTSRIGVTLNLYAVSPVGLGADDVDAARRIDGLANRWFLDPVLLGRYPADVVADVAGVTDMGFVHDGDLARIAVPLDLLGVNYYSRYVVAAADGTPSAEAPTPRSTWRPPSTWPGSEDVRFGDRGLPVTAMGWEIDPAGLLETLRRVHREYPEIPIYITENGAAFDDAPAPDGRIDDGDRIRYIDAHLRACLRAAEEGVPVRGYLAWSLMDNFEWAEGYTKTFGLIEIDRADDLARRPRQAALLYRDIARARAISEEMLVRHAVA